MDSIDISNSSNCSANNYYRLDITNKKNLSEINNNYDAIVHCVQAVQASQDQ